MNLKSRTSRTVNPTPVYCLTVPEYHNFAVRGISSNRESKSVFTHNCDADPD